MHQMRRVLGAASLCAWLLAFSGGAAAAERGTIEGRVMNETTGRTQAGVEVTLSTGTSADGVSVVETVTTDQRGRYVFEDLATGSDRFYAVDGLYEGGLFSGGAITLPEDTEEEPVVESTLKVWDTTTDPSSILIARNSLFLDTREANLGVVESVTIANTSPRAYIGRGGDQPGGARTSVAFALPQRVNEGSVAIVDADLNIPELVPTDVGFGATIAIPPGETRVTFSYTVRGTAAAYDLSRTALYPTAAVSVYAAEPLTVSSNRLSEGDEVEVGAETYREHTTEGGLKAGDALQVVAIAEAGTPASLLLGMAGVLALVLALGVYPFLRRRKDEPDEDPESEERDGLLRQIAELDLKRDRSEVDEEEWAVRRAELKSRLLGEPAPDRDAERDAEKDPVEEGS